MNGGYVPPYSYIVEPLTICIWVRMAHKADRKAPVCWDTRLFPGGSRLLSFPLGPRPDSELSSHAQSTIWGSRKARDWFYYMRVLMITDIYNQEYILS